MVRLLDSPIRIFRCPICVENGTDAPPQELSLVIEHLARHYEFYLFECRKCKDRFATPFLASFHIKEGRCKQEDGELSPDGEKALIAVSLDDVEFSSFCSIQNEITKCIQNMLKQQSEIILEMERKEVETMNKVRAKVAGGASTLHFTSG
ncbi:unnamed protein product [Heligmosomoides polygyrus]|uniref:C2H2-type domain-containing protein n=1 Tax=Heligmosomoides polygyrus TaxID=6339 RepID=A0A183FVH4_HELPZ|nr:unnamed protein product [Heligmosomoides polygyrus]